MNFLNLIPTGYKMVIVACAIAAIGLVYSIWHHTIYKSGYDACQNDNNAQIIKEEKKYAEIQTKVILLPDADLRERYCKWVRDDHKKCLQAHIPIRE